jgi:catechol 2,3-dioxygenase-like lactoylglutathione lyase family enzyme
MPRLDHLSLPVHDWRKSRDWYKDHLGFEVEFEVPERKTAAMRDDADLTIFLYEGEVVVCPGISFTVQVDDVAAKHAALVAAGVPFVHPPMKCSGATAPSCAIPTAIGCGYGTRNR